MNMLFMYCLFGFFFLNLLSVKREIKKKKNKKFCGFRKKTESTNWMCGIVGILVADKGKCVKSEIVTGLLMLQHRGQGILITESSSL